MRVSPGMHLGPYEILAPIGAGGMGEVYRAQDLRLKRTVAIKVLPGELSLNPQNRERLLREARAVSNLNHPNICTLHDIGSENGIDYLVMEYLEGDTLQQRLSRGPLPPGEALRYAIEIADALDRAHRSGVVHRDLKPGNVILTGSGAKLLDFGLAKTGAGLGRPHGDETVTDALTSEGTIAGTLQYMAPEQLEGKDISPRADIFAFGAVLYEMLAGRRAFSGGSAASIVASILTSEPPAAREITGGSALDRVMRKCLAKNPDRRWQTAADLKDELAWIAAGGAAPAVVPGPRQRAAMWWAGAAAVCALLAGWLAWERPRATAEPDAWNLAVPPPPDTVFVSSGGRSPFAISPDGHMLVFPVLAQNGSGLWLRDLTSGSQRPLPGTDNGHMPFWSPDSRNIGFFAGGKLKKIGLSGPPEVICNAGDGRGGSWNRDGTIVFTPRGLSVIHRVSASGGNPVPITTFDPARHENAHYFPYFLPDGRHFLYWARETEDLQKNGILIASLDDSPTLTGRPLLVSTPLGAIYAPSGNTGRGHLLYRRAKALVAQAFDPAALRVSSDAFPVADELGGGSDDALASVSATGVLVYAEPEGDLRRLVWIGRTGVPLGDAASPGHYKDVRLSPSGARIVVIRQDPEIGDNVWSIAPDGGLSRLTLNTAHARDCTVWSPDGGLVAFAQPSQNTTRGRAFSLFTVPVAGSADPARLTITTINQMPDDWSPDGRYLLFHQAGTVTQQDLWVLPLKPPGDPFPILATPFEESYGRISPDGRWLAYASDDTGASEIYVQSFSALVSRAQVSPKWTVSVDGGTQPVWRRDGKELFYRARNGALMSAAVQIAGEAFHAGSPKRLFDGDPGLLGGMEGFAYDAAPTGDRFIAIESVQKRGSRPLHVLTKWGAAR
jgi:serine/threonine protein kinase